MFRKSFQLIAPNFSGLGFIVGSKVASISNWQSGVRVTPPLGLLCLFAIIFLIKEPERGKAERDQGAENVDNQPDSTYLQDIVYLLKKFVFTIFLAVP